MIDEVPMIIIVHATYLYFFLFAPNHVAEGSNLICGSRPGLL